VIAMHENRTENFTCGGRASAARMRCKKLTRAAFGAAVIGLVALASSAAMAADDSGSSSSSSVGSGWTRMMQKLGLSPAPGDDSSNIDYTERSPLVVPGSRDLPPPRGGPSPDPNWPRDAGKPAKHTPAKPAVVPDTAMQMPNPPIKRKPWYDPTGWFSKEEYAQFPGEPVRESLTDPPAGYRIPSPTEPYGIGPDKKKVKPTAADFNLSSATRPAPNGQ
jgi:hypothetical protein